MRIECDRFARARAARLQGAPRPSVTLREALVRPFAFERCRCAAIRRHGSPTGAARRSRALPSPSESMIGTTPYAGHMSRKFSRRVLSRVPAQEHQPVCVLQRILPIPLDDTSFARSLARNSTIRCRRLQRQYQFELAVLGSLDRRQHPLFVGIPRCAAAWRLTHRHWRNDVNRHGTARWSPSTRRPRLRR